MEDILKELDKRNNELIEEIDKKIILKYRQVKNKHKTCMFGIDKILGENEIKELIKRIKKTLGCGGTIINQSSPKDEKEDERDKKVKKEIIIEFTGDHRHQIRELLLEQNIIESDKIVVR